VSETSAHTATDSAVGYYHQGLYALVVLLDAGDGARVSVETADDVTLEDGIRSLHQLKHSLDPPASFSIKTDGLWRTLKVWCDAKPRDEEQLVLATCAPLMGGSPLEELTRANTPRSAKLLRAFNEEATRVRAERAKPVAPGTDKPYAKRVAGCEAWLALAADRRQALLDKVLLAPSSFTAAQVPEEVSKRLRTVLPAVRPRLTERLIEWWDRQVVLALLSKRDRWLTKMELLSHIEQLIVEHSSRSLPNDVGNEMPPDLTAEMTGMMVRQIELVSGGPPRVQRAAVARWRARTQRQRWQRDDFAAAGELDEYDRQLMERWNDRFRPMKHDCSSLAEPDCRRKGLELLDWSHLTACSEVPRIRPQWTAEFLVQGSYQQLADERRVGWHPKYEELLAGAEPGGT